MATIRAPFNFVPLANKVYIPAWGGQISQDVPFSDGVSGYIDLTITALSPIFIRNGVSKYEAEQGKAAIKAAINAAINANKVHPDFTQAKRLGYNSFCKCPEGYFIPATSIKGEVRTLLEIMTFSKMRVDKNVKFAQREWYNEKLYPKQEIQKDLLCGYLKRDNKQGIYRIYSHGKPMRISHMEIDAFLEEKGIGTKIFEQKFSKDSKFNITKAINEGDVTYDPKTARYKYHLIGNQDILLDVHFIKDETSTEYSDRIKYSPNGSIVGDIVLTGQPGKWVFPRPNKDQFKKKHPNLSDKNLEKEFKNEVKHAGKFYEFVFLNAIEGEPIEMNEIDFNHFKYIYSESEEWPRVKDLLDNGSRGVPVFFRKETKKDKEGNTIIIVKDFGLAYLYKLPYENSPYDILSRKYECYNGKLDMAECLFGSIALPKEGTESFKGRIQFSNCISHDAEEYAPMTLVLNSPKASYYPIYIKQYGKGGVLTLNTPYHTYNDGELSGWKRYVTRVGDNDGTWSNKTGDPKIDTTLFPIKPGSTFKGKISFHNLRPVELGALLSALTFHSNDECCHLLGQGKPYGLGKTKYEVTLHCKERKEDVKYFMALFERTISKTMGGWRETDTIKSILTMAGKAVDAENENYKYMILSVNPSVNEFQNAKIKEEPSDTTVGHNPEYLQNYISFRNGHIPASTLLEPFLSIVEKNAKAELESLRKDYETMIAKIDKWIEKSSFDDAKKGIQEARLRIGNLKEPLLPVDVSDFIDGLISKEIHLSERQKEEKTRHYHDIYMNALRDNSPNAIMIIEETIALLKSTDISDAQYWINNLQDRKAQIERAKSNISTYLANVTIVSIPAFANQLKKRNDISPISNDDIPYIVDKLNSCIPALSKKEQKNWYDRNKWKNIEAVIGVCKTDEIYSQLSKG